MPIISTFLGVTVRMYYADHPPAHVHVAYQGHEALVALEDGKVIEGGLPRRVAAVVAHGASTTGQSWRRIGPVHRPSNHSHASPEPTMIKLIAAEHVGDYEIRVAFSDKTGGVLDLRGIAEAGTSMTEPLRDPTFFARLFIEAGALAWPNGLDFSARSLQDRLREAGRLEDRSAAA